MKTALLANIGTSDLMFDGEYFRSNQREKAKEILEGLEEAFDLYRSELSLPILEPVLYDIHKIDLLVLFATDQHQGKVEERFWQQDTIISAKVMKELIKKDPVFKEKVKKVEVIAITESPNIYDQMFKNYQVLFKEDFRRILRENSITIDDAYVSLTGGTPACNLALLLTSLHENRLGFCQFLYTSESCPDDKKVKYLGLHKALQKQDLLQMTENYLNLYNYDALYQFIDRFMGHERKLLAMIKALHYRKNFQFEEAKTEISRLLQTLEGYQRKVFRNLKSELDSVERGIKALQEHNSKKISNDEKSTIRELFWNATICYKTGNYIDFLGRFFRLQESLLRLVVECKLQESTSKKNWNTFVHKVESNSQLKDHLSANRVYRSHQKLSQTRYTYYCIARYFLNEDDLFLKWVEKGGVSDYGRDNKLVNLRNRCILGHDFEGISREEINALWGGDTLSDTETMLKDYFGIDMADIGIEEQHNWIISTVRNKF